MVVSAAGLRILTKFSQRLQSSSEPIDLMANYLETMNGGKSHSSSRTLLRGPLRPSLVQ